MGRGVIVDKPDGGSWGKGVSWYGFRRRRGEAEGWESWVGALWGFHSMGFVCRELWEIFECLGIVIGGERSLRDLEDVVLSRMR